MNITFMACVSAFDKHIRHALTKLCKGGAHAKVEHYRCKLVMVVEAAAGTGGIREDREHSYFTFVPSSSASSIVSFIVYAFSTRMC
jgi:hypothetical protein